MIKPSGANYRRRTHPPIIFSSNLSEGRVSGRGRSAKQGKEPKFLYKIYDMSSNENLEFQY